MNYFTAAAPASVYTVGAMRRTAPRHCRRQFLQGSLALAGLGLLSGCGVLPRPAQPPARVPRIGVLSPRSDPGPPGEAFRQGLRELDYVEGHNIALEWQFAGGNEEQFSQLAAELVRLDADVIVSLSSTATHAATQVTTTVPIVMAHGGDLVTAGLVASLARPGGNVTGVSSIAQQLAGKRLELLKEAVPAVSRVAILWNPTNPAKPPEWRETQRAAATLGVQLTSLEVRAPRELESVFGQATRDHAEALVVFAESVLNSLRPQILDLAAISRLPSMCEERAFAEAGGLMSYGPNIDDQRRVTATYVDKILKGAKPADLPVQQPTTFNLVINLKTARALGLTIPQQVLLQVTEVIQ